jgi:hypothetical protein
VVDDADRQVVVGGDVDVAHRGDRPGRRVARIGDRAVGDDRVDRPRDPQVVHGDAANLGVAEEPDAGVVVIGRALQEGAEVADDRDRPAEAAVAQRGRRPIEVVRIGVVDELVARRIEGLQRPGVLVLGELEAAVERALLAPARGLPGLELLGLRPPGESGHGLEVQDRVGLAERGGRARNDRRGVSFGRRHRDGDQADRGDDGSSREGARDAPAPARGRVRTGAQETLESGLVGREVRRGGTQLAQQGHGIGHEFDPSAVRDIGRRESDGASSCASRACCRRRRARERRARTTRGESSRARPGS